MEQAIQEELTELKKIVKELLTNDFVDSNEYSPLSSAICNEDLDKVKTYIKYGADINQLNQNDETNLELATLEYTCTKDDKYLEILELLIKNHGATNGTGYTRN